MSNVNYSLKNKGVRLIPAEKAWVKGKNGKLKLNPNYTFVGKIETSMSNMIVTASDKKKPKYKGSTYDLNSVAKGQIIDHFYNEKGKRNKRTVAYFGIEKKTK
ncbi:MAG: hypothetical protein J6C23_03260 [Clostridia bacterium]|nr:hypothetical protein [Clostridia bacterium]